MIVSRFPLLTGCEHGSLRTTVFLAVEVFPYQQAHEPLAISLRNTLCSRLPQRRC